LAMNENEKYLTFVDIYTWDYLAFNLACVFSFY